MRVTGATVHVVTAELDGGPIVAQAAVPVLDDDKQADVHDNPSKIFVFAFDQSDLTNLGPANTAQNSGWMAVKTWLTVT